MSIPGSASPLFFTAAADAAAAGPIKSVRFNSGDSAYLNRTPSSSGNRKTWTWSGWVKRSSVATSDQGIFGSTSGATFLRFKSNQLNFIVNGATHKQTSQVFRDNSSWYHFVWAVDTTQATASDRSRFYVNGVEVTDWGTDNAITQNTDTGVNNAVAHVIGATDVVPNDKLDAYLADFYLIDGSQLDPTSFGAFDDSGVWQAAAYSGSFGTNGFHLFDFANESGIGDDSSGNDNDFTANNLNLTDVVDPTSPASGNIYSNNYIGYYLNGNPPLFLTYDPGSTNRADSIAHGGNTGTTWAVNDVLQWAIDWDAGKIWLGRNNTWYASGNPAGGTNPAVSSFSTAYTYFLALGYNSNNFELQVPSSASYTPPTGFSYWGGQTLSTFKNSGTNQGGTPDIFKTAIPKSGKTYIEAIIKGGTNTYVTLGLCNFGDTTLTSDVLRDVPTNGDAADDTGAGGELSGNYATLNPLQTGSSLTLSDGSLSLDGASGWKSSYSTIFLPSGKWYFEVTIRSKTSHSYGILVGLAGQDTNIIESEISSGDSYAVQNGPGNMKINYNSGSTDLGSQSAYAVGQVLQMAYDADNGKMWFGVNGTYINSGNPSAGSNPTQSSISGTYCFAVALLTTSDKIDCNFGQRSWAYSAPTNFKAVCTSNLPTPTIADGRDHFDTKIYTGNGGTQTISGYEFGPDFVWYKYRSGVAEGGHYLFDTTRGAYNYLRADRTSAEGTYNNSLTAFTSSGFSVGDHSSTNYSNDTYVAWAWEAASSAASNTDGGITSSVKVNSTAGFSIGTFTGTGSTNTVGTGLSNTKMVMLKNRDDGSTNWVVYHTIVDGSYDYMYLNLTNANASSSLAPFTMNNTFKVASNADTNASGDDYIFYAFSTVQGYSSMGVYSGNSSSDGPFVHTNMRPAWVMVKAHDGARDWMIFDSVRGPENVNDRTLSPNTGNAEAHPGYKMDFLSNGFKLRVSAMETNNSALDYVYVAFAENPFQANGGLAR